MSADERQAPPNSLQYTPEKAQRIAEAYAEGATMRDICALYSDLPNPIYVKRWRDDRPDFDDLMTLAERARAEHLMEETLTIADDKDRQAAQANNAINARQKLAAALDGGKFGSRSTVTHEGKVTHEGLPVHYSEKQLLAILAGQMQGNVIDGELTPVPPLLGSEESHSAREVSTPKPATTFEEHSVTSDEIGLSQEGEGRGDVVDNGDTFF